MFQCQSFCRVALRRDRGSRVLGLYRIAGSSVGHFCQRWPICSKVSAQGIGGFLEDLLIGGEADEAAAAGMSVARFAPAAEGKR
jgi:hypothetical protein